jgi:hypothetical protein
MIIDPQMREIDEPIVTLAMTKRQAEWVASGLSDILCWCRGFNAASPDSANAPIGTEEARELNIALKKAIKAASEETK